MHAVFSLDYLRHQSGSLDQNGLVVKMATELINLRCGRMQRYLMRRRKTGVYRSLGRCRKVRSASHISSPAVKVGYWPEVESLIYTKLYAPDKLGMLSMLVEMLPSTIS